MCDPLTVAGMAASAIGTGLQQRNQAKNMASMAGARNDATFDNFRRQDEHQAESDERFGDVMARFNPALAASREQKAGERRKEISANAVNPLTEYQPASGGGPAIVSDEVVRQTGEANRRAEASGARGARIKALGDTRFSDALALDDSRGDLATTSDFARGTAALLPLEQQSAYNNAYKRPGMFPQLLKMAGTGASLAGFAGAGPGWGDIFGETAMLKPNNAAWGPGFTGGNVMVG